MHDLYRRPGLIEGIMMRGPQKTAVAVRLPDNTIETEYLEIKTCGTNIRCSGRLCCGESPGLSIPFLLGIGR